jgi:phosphate transport system substrate-binding protein
MVSALKGNDYALAYIGISFEKAVLDAKLGEAALENRSGKFVLPTSETVQAAARAKVSETPRDERISLIFAPGDMSYPIINYEYAIVKAQQSDPATARTLKQFLSWAISPDGGNAPQFMDAVNFVPLPEPIMKLSAAQITRITPSASASR